MKKNYTAPQSTAIKIFSEGAIMNTSGVEANNRVGSGNQLSNKKDAGNQGNSTWNSGLWSYDSDK